MCGSPSPTSSTLSATVLPTEFATAVTGPLELQLQVGVLTRGGGSRTLSSSPLAWSNYWGPMLRRRRTRWSAWKSGTASGIGAIHWFWRLLVATIHENSAQPRYPLSVVGVPATGWFLDRVPVSNAWFDRTGWLS